MQSEHSLRPLPGSSRAEIILPEYSAARKTTSKMAPPTPPSPITTTVVSEALGCGAHARSRVPSAPALSQRLSRPSPLLLLPPPPLLLLC